MRERLIDLAVAVAVLVAGIILVVLDERELGSMAVTASLGYITGALREKPGGLDEAVRVGSADLFEIEDGSDVLEDDQ